MALKFETEMTDTVC